MAAGECARQQRELILGVHAVFGNQSNWEIVRSDDGTAFLSFEETIAAKPDGVIGLVDSSERFERLQAAGVRAVVSIERAEFAGAMAFGAVLVDEDELAYAALEHFESCLCKRLVYLREGDKWLQMPRMAALRQAAERVGMEMSVVESPHDLIAIAEPVAVVCDSNRLAVQTVSACLAAGKSVPGEAFVIGVGNDDIICVDSSVTISSIPLRFDLQGRMAAQLLRRLLEGQACSGEVQKVPPEAICPRASTSGLGVSDAMIVEAIGVIRRSGAQAEKSHLNVEQLARRCRVSRRVLERRFRKVLGWTPLEAITRERVGRAKQLMRTTRLPVDEIAHRVGFADVKSLRCHFLRLEGVLPGEFRRQNSTKAIA